MSKAPIDLEDINCRLCETNEMLDLLRSKINEGFTRIETVLKERNALYKTIHKCSRCDGSGQIPYGSFSVLSCPKCDGSGVS